jgi:exopolysaccharide biosynthesis predicted pyruvyltransferase EpsI
MNYINRDKEFFNTFSQSAILIKNLIKNDKVFYLHNVGNWGDGFIRYSTKIFLDYYQIYYSEILEIEITNKKYDLYGNSILLYQGSGAFCKLWNHIPIIEKLSKVFKIIIVLPSTYELPTKTENVYFFSRDKYESRCIQPNSFFCHDLAFFLSLGKYSEGVNIGYFFRTDKESLGKLSIPSSNFDISRYGSHFSSPIDFIKRISEYNIIFTDRLHVAIAACKLNRIVHFYPGSYFKNRAVFLSSMKDFFPKCIFHDL